MLKLSKENSPLLNYSDRWLLIEFGSKSIISELMERDRKDATINSITSTLGRSDIDA